MNLKLAMVENLLITAVILTVLRILILVELSTVLQMSAKILLMLWDLYICALKSQGLLVFRVQIVLKNWNGWFLKFVEDLTEMTSAMLIFVMWWRRR